MELALNNGFQEMSFEEMLVVDGGGIQDIYAAVGYTPLPILKFFPACDYIVERVVLPDYVAVAASQPGQPYLLGLI